MEVVTLLLSIAGSRATAMTLAALVMGVNAAYLLRSNLPVVIALTIVILVFAFLSLTGLRRKQENNQWAAGEENTQDKRYHWESAALALALLMSLWNIHT